MAPSRFKKEARDKREVTPFNDDPPNTMLAPPDIPPEWRDIEAPINFTWVVQDELAGMGWPKSRDQVNFLLKQGIDHLITLAADKIPPHYAFPELKWTMIPVEDFTGPLISDIQKFIDIMAKARMDGEAVGVHCAEGRGRTGVICACYLIYYYDMEPWDAIRIMRRQRPGSVERKVQEETVVMFYDLLNEFGCLDNLEEKEKEYKRLRQQQQMKNDSLICPYTALLPVNRHHNKTATKEKMRRSRSMPKMNDVIDDSVKEETMFKQHIEDFFQDSVKRKTSRDRSRPPPLEKSQKDEENSLEQGLGRFERGTTPGRTLISNLKPAPRKSEVVDINAENKCDFRQHFKEFMSTNNSMKRARSFSQPRSENSDNKASGNSRRSRKEGSVEKCVEDRDESEKSKSDSRRMSRSKSPTASVASSSEATSASEEASEEAAESSAADKPVPDDPDNKEIEAGRLTAKPPPQPRSKPPLTSVEASPTSSTSSYYARVRTRAEVSRKRESEIKSDSNEAVSSAPNSTSITRKFSVEPPRSKTVDRDLATSKECKDAKPSNSTASEDVDVDQEVEEILSFSRQRKSAVASPPLDLVIRASVEASKNSKSPSGGLKVEARTSSDSLKVEQEKPARVSPFNRFRTSLVSSSSRMASATASGGRQRADSTHSSSGGEKTPNSEKRRFFYRKSRTGPLPGEEAEVPLTSNSASNSTSNLAASSDHHQSTDGVADEVNRHAVRAKSEFNPRTAAASSTSEYAAKDNYFLAAAKRWASYDKPSYHAPFTRVNWNRSHRKFNYSRFLSYTRETFV